MGDNTLDSSTSPPSDIDLNKYRASGEQIEVREHDRLLPIANVCNIMRKILPPPAKLSKEARETMQECVSEFISFVTAEASHQCQKEQRKTLTGEDLIWAMASLGLDDYAVALEDYLQRYRKAKAEINSVTEAGFLDHSSTENNQMDAREDPHQYHFHVCGHPVEGSSSHNQQ